MDRPFQSSPVGEESGTTSPRTKETACNLAGTGWVSGEDGAPDRGSSTGKSAEGPRGHGCVVLLPPALSKAGL